MNATSQARRPAAERSRPRGTGQEAQGQLVLETTFLVLLVLWLLGNFSSYTFGGFIHLLLLLAIAVGLARVVQGRKLPTRGHDSGRHRSSKKAL